MPNLAEDNSAPNIPPAETGQGFLVRLLTIGFFVYLIAWAIEFIFVAGVFGLGSAVALSLVALVPFVVAVRMQRQRTPIRSLDFVPLTLVIVVAVLGTIAVVQSWYTAGLHLPPSEEQLNWRQFGQELSNDATFKNLKIETARAVYWVSGSLQSEAELDRLIELASKCGINNRRLDGPFVHSISITIPGTSRATRYDTIE